MVDEIQVSEMVFQIVDIDNLCTTMHIEKICLIKLRFFFLPSRPIVSIAPILKETGLDATRLPQKCSTQVERSRNVLAT